jgi:hypothetical protein
MGIGFVLIAWAIIGTISAVLGGLTLGGVTAFFTRGVRKHPTDSIVVACVFPFACFGWAVIVFGFHAYVNVALLHRDYGLGDGFNFPLPNGYAVSMIDVTDCATVYNPKTQPSSDGVVGDRPDAINSVSRLQVAGPYIIGMNRRSSDSSNNKAGGVHSYFLLDTKSGTHTELRTYEAARVAAGKLGIHLNLQSMNDIYHQSRLTWFDAFSLFLLLVPPVVSFGLFIWWIKRLRKTRETPLLD